MHLNLKKCLPITWSFQSRDAILDNLLPVNEEEAIQLAGLQTHIQFGDYKEKKSTFLK